jgi:imidazolonepropionase-like amidohydrolase
MEPEAGGTDPLRGDILIRDGKIIRVGPTEPAGGLNDGAGEIFDASSYTVIPGLIDASSKLGLRASGMRWEGNEINEESENNIAGLSTLDGLHPLDETFREAARGGITAAVIGSGERSVIGAQSAAVKVKQKAVDSITLDPFTDLSVTLGNHVKRLNDRGEFPRSRMGIAAILRRAFKDAEAYGNTKIRGGIDEKSYDPQSEAMLRVLDRQVPLKITAYRGEDILTAIRIRDEFAVDIILNQCLEGYKALDEIAGRNIPVIVGQYLTPIDDDEARGRRLDLPAELHRRNIPIAFSTHVETLGYSFLRINAALAVKNGLPEYEALKALTINPARFYRLEGCIGSLKASKDADLLILDGHPLYSMTRVLKTMIDGVFCE